MPGLGRLVFLLGMEGDWNIICKDHIAKNARKGGISWTENFCNDSCNIDGRLDPLGKLVPTWMLFSTFIKSIQSGEINTDSCPDAPEGCNELEAQGENTSADEGVFREFNLHVLSSLKSTQSSHVAALKKKLKSTSKSVAGVAGEDGGGDIKPKSNPLLGHFSSVLKSFLSEEAGQGSLAQGNSAEVYEALRYLKCIKSVTLDAKAINRVLSKSNPPSLPPSLTCFYNSAVAKFNRDKEAKKASGKSKKKRKKKARVSSDGVDGGGGFSSSCSPMPPSRAMSPMTAPGGTAFSPARCCITCTPPASRYPS